MFITHVHASVFSKKKKLEDKNESACFGVTTSCFHQPNVNRRALNSLSLKQPHTLDSNTLS